MSDDWLPSDGEVQLDEIQMGWKEVKRSWFISSVRRCSPHCGSRGHSSSVCRTRVQGNSYKSPFLRVSCDALTDVGAYSNAHKSHQPS